MKLNQGGSQALQTVCSPGFVFILTACMPQANIYKAQPENFLTQLANTSFQTVIVLSVTVGFCYVFGFLRPVSANKKLEVEEVLTTSDYFSLVRTLLFSVLCFSSYQYFSHREETTLHWWNFFIAYLITIFLGYCADSGLFYLEKRRLNSTQRTEPTSHTL